MMKPRLGAIVLYCAPEYMIPLLRESSSNPVAKGDLLAAVIVKVWNDEPGCCNLRLLRDGVPAACEWVTSSVHGFEEHGWAYADEHDMKKADDHAAKLRGDVRESADTEPAACMPDDEKS